MGRSNVAQRRVCWLQFCTSPYMTASAKALLADASHAPAWLISFEICGQDMHHANKTGAAVDVLPLMTTLRRGPLFAVKTPGAALAATPRGPRVQLQCRCAQARKRQ